MPNEKYLSCWLWYLWRRNLYNKRHWYIRGKYSIENFNEDWIFSALVLMVKSDQAVKASLYAVKKSLVSTVVYAQTLKTLLASSATVNLVSLVKLAQLYHFAIRQTSHVWTEVSAEIQIHSLCSNVTVNLAFRANDVKPKIYVILNLTSAEKAIVLSILRVLCRLMRFEIFSEELQVIFSVIAQTIQLAKAAQKLRIQVQYSKLHFGCCFFVFLIQFVTYKLHLQSVRFVHSSDWHLA